MSGPVVLDVDQVARHRIPGVVVVDTETTGLSRWHVPVEVAWWDLETGERGGFIPPHTAGDIDNAHPVALEKNGYRARELGDSSRWDHEHVALRRLHRVLAGRTFAGAQPHFDAGMLAPLFQRAGLAAQPHDYHLWDLGSFARWPLRLRFAPKTTDVFARLGITPGAHQAGDDVTAEGLAFLELDRRMLAAGAAA